MGTLIQNAVSGINLIPTIFLGVMLIYWVTVIIGLLDIDLFDFDMDGVPDGFSDLFGFLNVKDMPLMIVLSIQSLVFWIAAMLLLVLPIKPGGLINGLLLIPTFIVSLVVTKLITNPLKNVFRNSYGDAKSQEEEIIGHYVTMTCDLSGGRLGQAEINRDGASILVNVKSEVEGDTFKKHEEAYVTRRDSENIYYVIKIHM